jgi:hypothetical protein
MNQTQPFQKISLVPTETIERLRRNKKLEKQMLTEQESVADPIIESTAAPKMAEFGTLTQEQALHIESLLPKGAVKNRAKVLLDRLIGRIRLTESQQIIYEDASIGSNLFDLVLWVCSATSSKRLVNRTQPSDARKFAELIARLGDVPRSATPQLNRLFELEAINNPGSVDISTSLHDVNQTDNKSTHKTTTNQNIENPADVTDEIDDNNRMSQAVENFAQQKSDELDIGSDKVKTSCKPPRAKSTNFRWM